MVAHAIAHGEPRRLTRKEYDKLVELGFFERERLELIRGTLIRMVPNGPAHSEPIDRLYERLMIALVGRARVRSQLPFVAVDDSEPEPDIAVVPLGSYAKEHPARAHLLVEVADSSLAYDRETKGPLYASSGVPEYWIVDVRGRAVEVYTSPVNGTYESVQLITRGGTLRPQAFPDVVVTVAELFDD